METNLDTKKFRYNENILPVRWALPLRYIDVPPYYLIVDACNKRQYTRTNYLHSPIEWKNFSYWIDSY